MTRRTYLISYDISDDRRRTKVFERLRDYGDHAQYSVFFCELTGCELAILRSDLNVAINHSEDQVMILDLGEGSRSLELCLECLGLPYQPTGRVLVV